MFRAFLQSKSCYSFNAQNHWFRASKNTNAVRAKNTNAVFSATKQMKEMQGDDAEKVLSQWEKVAKCILRVQLK